MPQTEVPGSEVPAPRGERHERVELGRRWLAEAASWLQVDPASTPPGAALPVEGWPLVLTRAAAPELGALAEPGGAPLLERYSRFHWRRPVPAAFERRWVVATDPGSGAVVVDLVAESGGEALASAHLVLRPPRPAAEADGGTPAGPDVGGGGGVAPWAAPPAPPTPERWRPSWSFTTREDELDTCAELVGRSLPVIDRASAAQQHGWPNRVVPGLVQLHLHAYRPAPWPPSATVEAWYRKPLPVGALTHIVRGPEGSHLSGLLLGDELVSLTRFEVR